LAYQWFFNRTNLVADGTNASLVLTNVGAAMAGDYSVVVANSVGTATSAVARLSVTFPPTHVSIPNQIAVSGNIVSLPVLVRANGNENSISFSLSYDRARLQFLGVEGGSGAGDGVVLVNDTATNSGSVGIAFALPPQATLATGTQEVVRVEFYAPIVTHASSITQLRFMDQPVVKRVVGVNANTLQSSFSSLVTITLQATPLESDVYPRSQGNRTMEVNDWVQTGRFVVGSQSNAGRRPIQGHGLGAGRPLRGGHRPDDGRGRANLDRDSDQRTGFRAQLGFSGQYPCVEGHGQFGRARAEFGGADPTGCSRQ
jgi:hypothetical protein